MEYKKQDNFPYNFGGLPDNKIWFTADPHFFHKNIIKYVGRPFKNIEEMNETLLTNWNKLVKKDDLIFVLGDFCLGSTKDCGNVLSKLNGNKVLIIGNHEKSVLKSVVNRDFFNGGIYERLEIRVNDKEVSDEFQDLILDHYTMTTWNKSHRGAWQLFGHVHGLLDNNLNLSPNQMDVGVDSHDYSPISYDRVKEIITQRNLRKIKG